MPVTFESRGPGTNLLTPSPVSPSGPWMIRHYSSTPCLAPQPIVAGRSVISVADTTGHSSLHICAHPTTHSVDPPPLSAFSLPSTTSVLYIPRVLDVFGHRGGVAVTPYVTTRCLDDEHDSTGVLLGRTAATLGSWSCSFMVHQLQSTLPSVTRWVCQPYSSYPTILS